jgi:SAM-dependent methyltransferase
MHYSNGIAHYYDLFATVWGQTDDAARFLIDLVPPRSSILEIGAGVGVTAAALAAAGFNVTALEPDPGMYAVMLSRLALRSDLESNLTPIPRPAGYPVPREFDSCVCFSVLHLLEPSERAALVSYAHRATRPGGHLVLEIPVTSAKRLPRPWELIAQRQFGEMRYEHHAAAEPLPDGSWHTHWKFRAMHRDLLLEETAQTFHWRPISLKDSDELLRGHQIRIEAEYAGFDRSPFQPNQSRVRLVVGRPA